MDDIITSQLSAKLVGAVLAFFFVMSLMTILNAWMLAKCEQKLKECETFSCKAQAASNTAYEHEKDSIRAKLIAHRFAEAASRTEARINDILRVKNVD